MTMRQTACTNHCSACGRHFHSVAAFDAHRVGGFASNDPELCRRCESPLDVLKEDGEMRLVLLTEEGVCRAYVPTEAPVKVWTMRDGLERARAYWGGE